MHAPRAVVLAAGDGSRLGPRTDRLPKPLVPFGNRPLISYTLDSIRRSGTTEVALVVGYRAGAIRHALGDGADAGLDLTYIENSEYERGASLSLAAAREFTGEEPFLLVMSDHLLSAELLETLLGDAGELTAVAADFRAQGARTAGFIAEATKVAVDSRRFVQAIGKQIEPWDALDAGAFWCTPAVWEAVESTPEGCELGTVFGAMAGQRALRATDISGSFWYDIDTDADLRAAGEMMGLAPFAV